MSRNSDSKASGAGAGKDGGKDTGTRLTVLVALGANLLIAVAKAVGGAFAGSPALLSEAAHSVADSFNEVFLLAALRRSRRPPDRRHPFGYGKERFFWSLLAAVGIFVMGGCFSVFQGIEALRSGAHESHSGYVAGSPSSRSPSSPRARRCCGPCTRCADSRAASGAIPRCAPWWRRTGRPCSVSRWRSPGWPCT